MERIQIIRANLQRLVESPRAPLLWAFILCISTLIFIGQVVGASYVYTIVRLGMDGQKTQQEKKIEQEVLLIYDVSEYVEVLKITETRPRVFSEAILRRTTKEESDAVPVQIPIDTTPQKKTAPASGQKNENQ